MVRREELLIVTGGIAGGFDANRPLTNGSCVIISCFDSVVRYNPQRLHARVQWTTDFSTPA